jgi:hypothetical protein
VDGIAYFNTSALFRDDQELNILILKVCSELLDKRKQAKLQGLQDLSEINGDNLNNARREASRHFRNKKRDNLKDKVNDL